MEDEFLPIKLLKNTRQTADIWRVYCIFNTYTIIPVCAVLSYLLLFKIFNILKLDYPLTIQVVSKVATNQGYDLRLGMKFFILSKVANI